jgi:hypothetical protein
VVLVVVLVVSNELAFAGLARALVRGPRRPSRGMRRDVLANS